jgi:hypothetical protein
MILKPLFPGRSLDGIDLKPDQLHRVRLSYPQIAESAVVSQLTSLTTQVWREYVDTAGSRHWIWIEYITVDTTFNIVDVYFYVDGSVAAFVIVGIVVIIGLIALAVVIRQVAIVVRGYPGSPASKWELPLIIVGGLAVLAVVIYYGTKSGALSKAAGRIAAGI